MKGIMLFADHFEDIEALGTLDLLRRAGLEVDTVSITGKRDLVTQSGLKLKADKLIDDINMDKYEFLIIPGGAAVSETHLKSPITFGITEFFARKNLLIGCICAAPSILGAMHYLDNIKYTCFPGFEKYAEKGIYTGEKVTVSGNFITSKGAGTMYEFAGAIIEKLLGKEVKDKVLSSIYYN